MCDLCKLKEKVMDKLPTELKKYVERGPVGNMVTPASDKLRTIMDAGPGEHQDRLWRLAVRESKDNADKGFDFLVEKYSVELQALQVEFSAVMRDLLKGDLLHKKHGDSPDPELVN